MVKVNTLKSTISRLKGVGEVVIIRARDQMALAGGTLGKDDENTKATNLRQSVKIRRLFLSPLLHNKPLQTQTQWLKIMTILLSHALWIDWA